MKILVIKTISGQFKIVDAGDNEYGAPLISFHNGFNNEKVVAMIYEKIIDQLTVENLVKKIEKEDGTIVTRFELMEFDNE